MPRIPTIAAISLLLTGVAASAQGLNSPYGNSSNSPRLYAPNGQFLGNVNSNPYDPDSIANPYGRYGNRFSPDSINNPYGQYGNPYSPNSVRNPFGH